MDYVRLGRTNLKVNKNGFGALPLQRVSFYVAKELLRKAYDHGITFFDTARGYTDSEEKIGLAFYDLYPEIRHKIVLASKSGASDGETFLAHLETSLTMMKTDYVDIYQFHNPAFVPRPGGKDGLYDAMFKAKAQGKVRFIGASNHRFDVAKEIILSGLYDTIQFPFTYLSEAAEEEIVNLCETHQVGFIGMKGMAGGLITDSALAYAFLNTYPNVMPIWGIQRECELDEFISYQNNAPILTNERLDKIASERQELAGNFCRACGYCLPCPANINIPNAARISLLLRRTVPAFFLNLASQEEMARVDNCSHCNHCIKHCPYGLNVPELIKVNYEDYKDYFKCLGNI